MKLALSTAVAAALTLAAGAQAIGYVNWPNSVRPVFIGPVTIRFTTNLATQDWTGEPWTAWIWPQGGGGIRSRATADQATAPALPPPAGEHLEFANPSARSTPLYLVAADGQEQLIDAEAYGPGGAALSPDGKTVVFAQWVGWTYADSSVLYAAAVGGSREPWRVTPTRCAFISSGPLRGGCFQGTDGNDVVVGKTGGDLVIAGAGNDVIRAGDGQNEIQSQWGNDTITTGSGHDEVWAGAGDDVIRTGAGSDLVVPGTGRDTVATGRGDDYVYANDGQRDVVDCGPGVDGVVADAIDTLRHCEHVWVRPPFTRWPAPR